MKKFLILLVLSFGFLISNSSEINTSLNSARNVDAWCRYEYVRVGAVCNDGWVSSATGSGACSWHGGVDYWLYDYEYVCD
tara:strand:+ start:132 stop:371 length:240 start_codon:yes stop_codon:yes gene_type:complete